MSRGYTYLTARHRYLDCVHTWPPGLVIPAPHPTTHHTPAAPRLTLQEGPQAAMQRQVRRHARLCAQQPAVHVVHAVHRTALDVRVVGRLAGSGIARGGISGISGSGSCGCGFLSC